MGKLEVIEWKGRMKYQYVETPDFGTNTFDRVKYINEEDERISNGWMGLSGLHYFYLSKSKLHEGATGRTYQPMFRMVDKKIIDIYLWCKNHKLQEIGFPPDGDDHPVLIGGMTIPDPYDLIIVKPRRLALTSIMGAGIIPYNSIESKGCSQGLTSNSHDNLIDLRNDKLYYARESCIENGLLSSQFRWNNDFLQFPFNVNNKSIISNIWMLDTAKDDKAAASPEGHGFLFFFLDEWFLHNKAAEVKMSVKDTLVGWNEATRSKRKLGVMVQGGSCNYMTKGSIIKLKDALKDSEDPSAKTKFLFISGLEGQCVDEFGFDNLELALEKDDQERAALRKANKWTQLQNRIKSYPRNLKELISNVESDYFSPNVVHHINSGLQSALNIEPLQCTLLNKNGHVFTDNTLLDLPNLSFPEGNRFPYLIYKDRIPGHLYGAGGDPIDFMGANVKGSFLSMTVKDFTTNEYVASLEFRTTDPELGYNLWYNLIMYYNFQPRMCLFEKNKLGSLLSMCKIKGTLDFLAFDPDKKNPASDDDRGYHKHSGNTMSKIMGYGKLFLEYNTVPFLRFNENFPNYQDNPDLKIKKADICDAFLSTEYLYNSLYLPESDQDEYSTKTVYNLQRAPSGELIEVPTIIVVKN